MRGRTAPRALCSARAQLLSYALVLSDNHIFTSGATGTHAAAIRGALRAENPELLTVILPQTIRRQPREIRDLLGQVQKVIELSHDALPLDAASRLCNSELLSKGDQLIVFAFHDSKCAPPARIPYLALPRPTSPPPPPPAPHTRRARAHPRAFPTRAGAFGHGRLSHGAMPHMSRRTLRETIEEAKAMSLLTTVLFLD